MLHLFGIILYYLVDYLLDYNVVLCTKLKMQKKASLCKQQATTLIKIILLPFEKIQYVRVRSGRSNQPDTLLGTSCLCLFFASHQTLGKLRVQQIFIHKVRLKLWGDTKVLLLYRHFSNTSGQMLGQLTKSLSNLTRRQFKYSFQ